MKKECRVSGKTNAENLAGTIVSHLPYGSVELTAIGRAATSVAMLAIGIAVEKIALDYVLRNEYFDVEGKRLLGTRIFITADDDHTF